MSLVRDTGSICGWHWQTRGLRHRFASDLRDSFSFRTFKAAASILKGRSIDTVKVDKSSANRLSSPTVPGKTESIRATNCFPSEVGRA